MNTLLSTPNRAVTLLAFAALALTGCTSTPEIPGGNPTADTQLTVAAYADCLRSEGVENVMIGPDGYVGLGVSSDAAGDEDSSAEVTWDDAQRELFEKAEAVCRERVPAYSPPTSADGPDPAQLTRARAFAACARENGFAEFADPDELGQLDMPAGTSKEEFLALVTACLDTIAPEVDGAGGYAFALPSFGDNVDPAWMEDVAALLADYAANHR